MCECVCVEGGGGGGGAKDPLRDLYLVISLLVNILYVFIIPPGSAPL